MSDERSTMRIMAMLGVLALAAIGVAGIIFGEIDDSPGGQLLGGLFVVGALWLGVRTLRLDRDAE